MCPEGLHVIDNRPRSSLPNPHAAPEIQKEKGSSRAAEKEVGAQAAQVTL